MPAFESRPFAAAMRAALALVSLVVAPTAFAFPAVVTIGNGPSSQTGDFIDASDISNTLAFTSVTIQADEVVRVEAPIDLSVSPLFGPTRFDVFLQAPVEVEILGDVRMGAGSVWLTAPSVRLEGALRDADGNALDSSRLQSPATGFVVGAGGSVLQASLMAVEYPAQATEIIVDGASDPNLVNVWSHVRLELRSGFVENLTLQASGSELDWRGGQIGDTGLFGFGGTIRIHGSQFETGPYTVCSNIPPSGWMPAPASLTNVGACLRGRLSTGESFLVVVNFGGTIEFVQADPPAAVPGPGWLIVPALGLVGWRAAAGNRARRGWTVARSAVDHRSAAAP